MLVAEFARIPPGGPAEFWRIPLQAIAKRSRTWHAGTRPGTILRPGNTPRWPLLLEIAMPLTDLLPRLPFPIAAVYADLDRADASPQTRREAVYFTAYQPMRTVGLTLVGQYLTRDLPPAAALKARD